MSEPFEGDVLPKENDNAQDEELDNEALMRFTQSTRKKLADAIIGDKMPTDKDEQIVLLRVLSDMDTTTINRLRHDVDKKSLENDQQVQQIIAEMSRINPRGLRQKEPVDVPAPEISPADLPDKKFTEEEKRVGVSSETAKDFLERMDNENSSEGG